MSIDLSQSRLHRKANLLKKELLCKLLTTRHCPRCAPYLSTALRRGNPARGRLETTNVVGVGYGCKETNGSATGDLAVRVYVRKKVPLGDLTSKDRIPASVGGVPTDVLEVGEVRFHARPAGYGASIRHAGGLPGSLGCIVTGADRTWYLLSASHVLAPAGAAVGDKILEPGAPPDGAAPIATLVDFEPLRGDGAANRYDAAVARIDRRADVVLRAPRIGPVPAQVMEPVLFQSVRKFGATTYHTLGVVTDVDAEVVFTMDGEPYLFQQVVQVTGCGGEFSAGGDSGALAVDALSNRPVGLVIGGAGDRTFASPLGPILARFASRVVED